MENVMYEGKEYMIVADYGNGQIEIREVKSRREVLVSKDKIQPVIKMDSHATLQITQKKNSLWITK